MVSRLGIAVVVVAVAVVAYAALGGFGSALPAVIQSPAELRAAQFASQNAASFISYNDTTYGFSFAYPIGYSITAPVDETAYLYLSAFNPNGLSETLTVSLSNNSMSDSDFAALAAALPSQAGDGTLSLISREKRSVGGRDEFVLRMNMSAPDREDVFVTSATVDCGDYSATMVSHVPSSIAADLAVAEYMLGSFRC